MLLEADTGAVDAGDDIFVEFHKDFGRSDSITSEDVLITSEVGVNRESAASSWDGRTLRITVPDMNGDTAGTPGIDAAADPDVKIRIKQSAGITNPVKAGLYELNIQTLVVTTRTTQAVNIVEVIRFHYRRTGEGLQQGRRDGNGQGLQHGLSHNIH